MSYLLVISAGMGTPSSSRMLGDRLAAATVEAQSVRSEIKVLELRDVAVDLAHFYTSHVPSRALQDAFDLVGKAPGSLRCRRCSMQASTGCSSCSSTCWMRA